MIYTYVNDVDRTSDVQAGSLKIDNQLQQRADTAEFKVFQNTQPSENQDVRLFRGCKIASAAGAVMTLSDNFSAGFGIFYPGQSLKIRIGDADEEACTVLSYVESTLTLTLTASPSGSVVAGDKIGELVFGGVVSRVTSVNVAVRENVEYEIECVDYNKIFDKQLISDTWVSRDARYIINDFCNSTINYNSLVDDFEYADNTAIQAEWIESGDGANPTVDASDYRAGDKAGAFSWTYSGGVAAWAATPTQTNVSDFTGTASGTPTDGIFGFWIKAADYTRITKGTIRLGSDSSNYRGYDFTLSSNSWTFVEINLTDPDEVTGTPVWTAFDYAVVRITETASSSVKIDDMRFLQETFFRHYPHVATSPSFDDLRMQSAKPSAIMQLLAKTFSYIWYIDHERKIHFNTAETDDAPFSLTATSDNYVDLEVQVDQSQLGNRILVRGGEKTSDSTYAQVFQGDSVLREWILKSKFDNLAVTLDDGTGAHAAEVGTNTTNIKVTAHGLATGAHVTNRTRGVVREITYVDADNFTVEAVTSQTNGDNITFFSVAKTDGVEGIDDEASFDYMANSNEKSVRATSATITLTSSVYIRFAYNERVPIQIQYSDSASVSALKALGFGNGVFDLETIVDRNIKDISTALAYAQGKVSEYSNPVITGKFTTNKHGLKAGQIIQITDSVRGLDSAFVIQKVRFGKGQGHYGDLIEYSVDFGTTLFGIIEFFQKLLAIQDNIEVNTDEVIETFVDSSETVEASDVCLAAKDGGFKSAKLAETVTTADVNTVAKVTPWHWEPNGVGQALTTRWGLFSWES